VQYEQHDVGDHHGQDCQRRDCGDKTGNSALTSLGDQPILVATSVDERALRLIGEHRAVESAAAEAEGIRVALHPDVEGGLLAAGGQLGDRVLHRDPAAIHDRDLADRLHLVEQCGERSTVRPSATKPRITWRNSRIPAGSSPFVGSSRISSSGSASRLRATPSR